MSKVIGKLTLASVICLFSTVAWTGESYQDGHIAVSEPVLVKSVYETSHVGETLIAKAMLDRIIPGISSQIAGVTDQDEASDETSGVGRLSKWNVDLFGGTGFGDDEGELYTTHLSFQTGKPSGPAMAWQPFTGFAAGKKDTAGLLGLDLIFKWPLYSWRNMALHFEGGGGIQYSSPKSWPNSGSHFNWRPQFGFGLRINTDPDRQMLFGVRYIHISNGGTKDYNSNVNEIFVYGGVKIRF